MEGGSRPTLPSVPTLKTDDPKKAKHRITLVWLACIVLYVGAVIAGWAVAAGGNGAASGGLGFAVCFSIVVTGLVGCFGTTVMRKYPTPPAMGIFLGVVSVLSMQYLILSAIFAGQAENASQDDDESEFSNDVAFSMFSCFLFIIFLFFSTLVWTYKDHLITIDPLAPSEVYQAPVGSAAQPAAEGNATTYAAPTPAEAGAGAVTPYTGGSAGESL